MSSWKYSNLRLALTAGIALVAFGIIRTEPAWSSESVFKDGTRHEVAYGEDAQRIVSLMPNVTEMLFFLGFGDRVVGRSQFCDYPPEVVELPSIGGIVDTGPEQILALHPDLVVAYQGNSLSLVNQLRTAGINVVAFYEATTVEEIGQQMETLYRIAAKPDAPLPSQLINWESGLQAQVALCDAHRSDPESGKSKKIKELPSVYYGYPGELSYTCSPGSFIDSLISHAGGKNVVAANQERWPQVGAEFILAAKPSWLLLSTSCTDRTDLEAQSREMLAALKKDKIWGKLPAVKSKQIMVLDANILLRPGPRTLDALITLRRALHPDWN